MLRFASVVRFPFVRTVEPLRFWSAFALVVTFAVLAGCDAKRPAELAVRAENSAAPNKASSDLTMAGATAGKPADNRKIIYRAKVELAVEDFAPVQSAVAELVKKHEGYVADSNLTGSNGATRRGTWRLRVPVKQFDAFVASAKGLGEVISATTGSEDVSEEYYDVEARIRNKTKEEERLLKLLDDRTGKLTDVLQVEHELSRVREEVERMQGRLRVLADLTSLTTIELTITEIRGYQPPEVPTLAKRIERAFTTSLHGVQSFGENLLVGVVGFAPWAPVWVFVLLPIYAAYRRWNRKLAR
ncbi:MAG: DUF4349 domain-containing protein [Pirellulales bacterium]